MKRCKQMKMPLFDEETLSKFVKENGGPDKAMEKIKKIDLNNPPDGIKVYETIDVPLYGTVDCTK